MKNFMLASLLTAFSFNAFSSSTLSCHEMYIKTMNHKNKIKNKIDRMNNASPGLLIVVPAINPVAGLTLLGAALGAEIYATTPSKEEKILKLSSESSKKLDRFVKKLQKDISCEITESEVKAIISEGLESGVYCEDFPNLYSVQDVKKHVKRQLIQKYQP
jgi:hypothetical protein